MSAAVDNCCVALYVARICHVLNKKKGLQSRSLEVSRDLEVIERLGVCMLVSLVTGFRDLVFIHCQMVFCKIRGLFFLI